MSDHTPSRDQIADHFAVSVELMRQARIVKDRDPNLAARARAGEVTVHAAYRRVMGDDRRALYVKLPAWLDDQLSAEANSWGVSRQRVVVDVLAEYLAGGAA